MKEILTAEVAGTIAKLILEWGAPGIFLVFLLEERRRLLNRVETLQNKLDASYEARIQTNKDALDSVSKIEHAYDRLSATVTTFLVAKPKGD